jgi:hypothetical protein
MRFGLFIHSMYDGLDGSCSIFHFEIRVALTSRVLISFISFLDEKFRTPLILKVGGTAWTKNALGGIVEVINVASSSTFDARGFSLACCYVARYIPVVFCKPNGATSRPARI